MRTYKIIVDTREQKPLFKGEECIVQKLDTGDYSIAGETDKIAIEYKAAGDIFGTITGKSANGENNIERFKRELVRAEGLEFFAIVVCASHTAIDTKQFSGAQYIKYTKGSQINKTLCTWIVRNGVHVHWVNTRAEARKLMFDLFDAYMRNKK